MLRIGSGASIIAAIREAPRALTFVSVPWSVPDWRASQACRTAVTQPAHVCPAHDIRFFIVDLFRHLWVGIQLLKQGASGGGPQRPMLA